MAVKSPHNGSTYYPRVHVATCAFGHRVHHFKNTRRKISRKLYFWIWVIDVIDHFYSKLLKNDFWIWVIGGIHNDYSKIINNYFWIWVIGVKFPSNYSKIWTYNLVLQYLITPVYSGVRSGALPTQSHDVIVFGGPWMLHFSRKRKISPFTVEPRLRSF